tara:strand:+ start:434 stop:967 length:534 start_codon:yes stop_codon:yes gene_type:complete
MSKKNKNDEENFDLGSELESGQDCDGESDSDFGFQGFDPSLFEDFYDYDDWTEIGDASPIAPIGTTYNPIPDISTTHFPYGQHAPCFPHGELEVGDLVDIGLNHGIIVDKIDVNITDKQLEELSEKGIYITASSVNNVISNWDFRHGHDNNFYVVAVTQGKENKKVMIIGWRLKQKV